MILWKINVLQHKKDPNVEVSLKTLENLGVVCNQIDPSMYEKDDKYLENPELIAIQKERGYTYSDLITITPELLPNYEAKIKSFFEEHLHSDNEIRYIVDGSGYFDIRNEQDEWIRILCRKSDMIVLPAGMYHRFTLDDGNYIKVVRLFVGEPVWTPINRPADQHDVRISYVKDFFKK